MDAVLSRHMDSPLDPLVAVHKMKGVEELDYGAIYGTQARFLIA
jgi:hypothetical protein